MEQGKGKGRASNHSSCSGGRSDHHCWVRRRSLRTCPGWDQVDSIPGSRSWRDHLCACGLSLEVEWWFKADPVSSPESRRGLHCRVDGWRGCRAEHRDETAWRLRCGQSPWRSWNAPGCPCWPHPTGPHPELWGRSSSNGHFELPRAAECRGTSSHRVARSSLDGQGQVGRTQLEGAYRHPRSGSFHQDRPTWAPLDLKGWAGPGRAGCKECEERGCPEVTAPSTFCVRLPPQLLEEPSKGDGGCGLYSRRSLFVGGT